MVTAATERYCLTEQIAQLEGVDSLTELDRRGIALLKERLIVLQEKAAAEQENRRASFEFQLNHVRVTITHEDGFEDVWELLDFIRMVEQALVEGDASVVGAYYTQEHLPGMDALLIELSDENKARGTEMSFTQAVEVLEREEEALREARQKAGAAINACREEEANKALADKLREVSPEPLTSKNSHWGRYTMGSVVVLAKKRNQAARAVHVAEMRVHSAKVALRQSYVR